MQRKLKYQRIDAETVDRVAAECAAAIRDVWGCVMSNEIVWDVVNGKWVKYEA